MIKCGKFDESIIIVFIYTPRGIDGSKFMKACSSSSSNHTNRSLQGAYIVVFLLTGGDILQEEKRYKLPLVLKALVDRKE